MTKLDPYKHEERFLEWKKRASEGIHEVTKENSDIILKKDPSSPLDFSKKLAATILIAGAAGSLFNGYQAYETTKKLNNPEYVQRMSAEEVQHW